MASSVKSALFNGTRTAPRVLEAFFSHPTKSQFANMNRLELRYAVKQLDSIFKAGDKSVVADLEKAKKALEEATKEVRKINDPVYPALSIKNPKPEVQAAYDYLCSGITYTELYNALVRGYQPLISKKMLKELQYCRIAADNFTQAEFDQLNPHKLALLVWRLLQSGECPDESVAGLVICIDRTPNRKTPPQINHQPDIMEKSWLVEAFNNRHNPDYNVDVLSGAKSIDTDLSKLKVFLHDIELVPRRLNLLLGLHHYRTNSSFPIDGLPGFLQAMYDWGFIKQIPAFLVSTSLLNSGKRVPNEALYTGIRAACERDSIPAAIEFANYLRVMNDIPNGQVLPLPMETAWQYAMALQKFNMDKRLHYCFDSKDEPNAILDDLVTRGLIKPLLSKNVDDLFVPVNEAAYSELVSKLKDGNLPYDQLVALKEKCNMKDVVCDLSDYLDENRIYFGLLRAMSAIAEESIAKDKPVKQPLRVKIAGFERIARYYTERRLFNPREVVNNCGDEDTTVYGELAKKGKQLSIDDEIVLPPPSSDPKQELYNLIGTLDDIDAKPDAQYDRLNPLLPKDVYESVYNDLPEIIRSNTMVDEVSDIISMRLGLGELTNPNRVDPVTLELVRAILIQLDVDYDVDQENGNVYIHSESLNEFVEEVRKIKMYDERVEAERLEVLEANKLD